MEFAFWNTLHDGVIDSISGTVPGDLTLTVNIEYLCEQLPTTAQCLRVSLSSCTLFSYSPDGEALVMDLQKIAGRDVEVLSANVRGDRVEVDCAGGTLEAAYQGVEIRLMEGSLVSQTDVEAAARRYWSAWSARHKNG